jgi:flagellar hook assembly protein FlgD
LRIYAAAGRPVAGLIDEARPVGSYTAEWNGRGDSGNPLSSGVYFYRLTAGDFEETRKMILLR